MKYTTPRKISTSITSTPLLSVASGAPDLVATRLARRFRLTVAHAATVAQLAGIGARPDGGR